jgi:predicted GH43/DUF377 family glycosyl hydrolase
MDKNNPEQILYRSTNPVLSPQADYERFGKVPNVVFSCGDALWMTRCLCITEAATVH